MMAAYANVLAIEREMPADSAIPVRRELGIWSGTSYGRQPSRMIYERGTVDIALLAQRSGQATSAA